MIYIYIYIYIYIFVGWVNQSVQRLTTGWTVRDRIPMGTRLSARPDRPCDPHSFLLNGHRVFPGGKVRPGRAADHSYLSSAPVLEEQSDTSTHPVGRTGPVTGALNLYLIYIYTYIYIYIYILIDTLLLTCTPLHYTCRHFIFPFKISPNYNYTCRHFTSSHLNFTHLHFTTLHYPLIWPSPISIPYRSTSPNITKLHLT